MRLPPFSVPACGCAWARVRACAEDPERMLFSSFVVTNRRPVEKGVMPRAASQLTPDISFEPDRWGDSGRAPLPHSEEMTTCALSTPDRVLRAQSECLIVPP